jgi:steroid delta-isomerase
MSTKLAALTAVALIAGCGAHPSTAPSAPASSSAARDEAEIRHALADWVTAFNGGDYARAATVWAPDLIGWYPGAPDDTYADEQAAATRPREQGAPRVEYALAIDEVMVSGDLAVVRDTWTEVVRRKDAPARSRTFRSFEVWRRQADGHWRIARWIDSLPPSEGAAKG